MKAYRHEDGSIWTFRPEENAERMARSSHRLALPVLDPEDFVQAVDALVEVDQRWVPDGAGEKSLYLRPFMIASEVFLGVRPAQHVTFMVIASPGRRLLQGRHQAGDALAHRGVHPRRPRRHGCGQDRRQLRQLAGARSRRRSRRAATRWSSSTRRGEVRRGARRHEHVLRLRRRPHRHPRDRHDPRGHHPLARSSSWPARWATRSRSASSRSTSGATASPAARSPRSSPAAPPPSSPRSATLKWDGGEVAGARRRGGTADHADPPGPGRHPVRPRRGHLRLDAPDRVTVRPGRPIRVCSPHYTAGYGPLDQIAREPDALARLPRPVEAVQRFVARRVSDPHLAADLTADIILATDQQRRLVDGTGARSSPGCTASAATPPPRAAASGARATHRPAPRTA